MHTVTIELGGAVAAGGPSFHEPGNAVWFATSTGEVRALRLLDRRERLCGAGYDDPVAAVPLHDGLGVAVVEHDGRVRVVHRDAAHASDAATVADLGEPILAARLHPDFGMLLVLTDDGLHSVDTAGGGMDIVTTGLSGAVAFAVDEPRREAFVLRTRPDGTQRVSKVALDDGDTEVLPQSLSGAVCLVAAPLGDHGVLVTDGSGNAVVHRTDGTSGSGVLLGHPVAGLACWGSLLLAVEGSRLHATEWDLDPGPMPVTVPLGPLFVRGYADVPFEPAAVGLAADDVEFEVDEGPECGTFSAGTEPTAPDGSQVTILLAALCQGEFRLLARERGTGQVLATRRFRVTACWPDAETGPPVAVTGEQELHPLSWGGVGGVAGYAGKKPAPPEWRVAVVLVSTKDRRFGDTDGTAQGVWKDRLTGDATSARTYLEEVSYFNRPGGATAPTGTTVRLLGDRVLGPVDLDQGWGDLFKVREASDLNGGWTSTPTGPELMAQAISAHLTDQPDGYAIARDADAYVIVVRSASDGPVPMGNAQLPTMYIWDHARPIGPKFWRKDPATSTLTQGPRPIVVMADTSPGVVEPGPAAILCHELCHTFGLEDLYDSEGVFTAEVTQHLAKWADLMTTFSTLPHLSIANRIRLGWLPPAWLRRFDFTQNPNGGTVTLHAVADLDRSGPPAGRAAGIEVPINAWRSYLFEYRREQNGMVGDQTLEPLSPSLNPRFVLGTDVDGTSNRPARPPILLLPEDADGNGPVLDSAGEDFEDNDVTDPARMFDFRVIVDSIGDPDPNAANVRVEYIGAHRPQLLVHPAPGRGDFKSPDIELLNPLGTFFTNSVIKGAPNRLRVTVHNVGTVNATDVLTHVKWLPITTTAGAWRQLPDPPRIALIPAKGSVSFDVVWQVPASVQVNGTEVEHFCFRVDIDRFRDPLHPEHDEIVEHDNWAQSNFETVSVGNGSPSQRIRTLLGVTNELSRPSTDLLDVQQSRDLFRVYIGNAWLHLGPGETRHVELAYESLAGDPHLGGNFEDRAASLVRDPNRVAIGTWRVPPPESDCATPKEAFGANLQMHAGRHCWFEDVRPRGEIVTARLLTTTEDGGVAPLPDGPVYLSTWSSAAPERPPEVTAGEVDEAGIVRAPLGEDALASISKGEPVTGILGRPADTRFARAVSEPADLR